MNYIPVGDKTTKIKFFVLVSCKSPTVRIRALQTVH